jgi:hypothetical protein
VRTSCPTEQEVVRAVRAGDLPPSLHDHAEGCASCSLALRLAIFFAQEPIADQVGDETGQIWRRAQAIAFLSERKRPAREQRLTTLDRIGAASLRLLSVLGLALILDLAWTNAGPLTLSVRVVAAVTAAALIVGGLQILGIWRQVRRPG